MSQPAVQDRAPAPEGPGASGSRRLARSALRGTAWTGASEMTGKLLFFVSTLILARILDQADFGVAAYAITVIALFNAVPGLGLAPALIYHRDDPEVTSTGFWLGLASACAGFALVWLLAPLTAHVFDDPRAVAVTRTLALVFPIEALRNVHATLLRKRLAFKRRFVPELVQSLAKGGVAIGLAVAGFGYWSLIWGSIAASVASVPAYWAASRWRPRLAFDRRAARQLIPFGGHVVAVDLLGALVRNLDYLLIGRILGAAALGVYVLAFRIPDLLIRNLSLMLSQVLLPVYSRVKSDPVAVRETFLATTSYVFAVTAPMAVGLALVAEPLVLAAFSEKWIDVVPVIPPICLYALFISLSFNVGDLYKALGRPDVLTRLALLRGLLVIPTLWFAAARIGTPAAVGWAQAAVALAMMTANFSVARALFDLPVRDAFVRLTPIAAASAAMAMATLAVGAAVADEPPWVRLIVCASAGAAVYVAALWLWARAFLETGLAALRDALGRRTPAPEGAR